jgi:RNA polymerase sigma-70 factor (ECF subfamily)
LPDLRQAIDPEEWPARIAFVRRLARSLVSDLDGAEDVAQETWLAWLRAPPRQATTLRGWLGRVVRNVVRMRNRGDGRRLARERASARTTSPPSTADAVAQVELHRRVVERVLALDEPHREVIVLRFFEQRSLDEVAQALAVPVETVKTRQKRALQRLRAELLGDVGGIEGVGDRGRDDKSERFHALLLLASAGGGTMTIGTKSVVAIAAGLLALLAVSYSILEMHTHASTRSELEVRAAAPAAAVAPPREAAQVAVRIAEEPATKTSPVTVTVPDRTDRRKVTGDVVDGAGRPLAKRKIELFATEPRTGRPAPVDSTESDDHGRFAFAAVPFARRSSGVVMAWDGVACTGESFDPRVERPLHLVLGATRSIVGRVIDETGNPVAGATLIASSRSRGRDENFFVPPCVSNALTDTADEQGYFTLAGLPCGWKVYVDVAAEGFASRREPFVLDETSADVRATIVLLPECTIEGRVTFADGSPAPAIRIGAQIQDQTIRMRNSWGETATDVDGRYRIRGLEAGAWNVLAMLDETQEREWCAAAGEGVQLGASTPNGTADFALRRGGELIIHVVDAATKGPVADVWIGIKSAATAASGAAIKSVVSDDDGIARIRLPPGDVFPYLSEPSQEWTQHGGKVAEGETLESTVEIDRGVKLRGVVRDPDGQLVANARVWSLGPGRSFEPIKTTTGEDGTFEITLVVRGNPWMLRAATTGLAMRTAQQFDPAITDPDDLELTLVARPANKLRGCVVDAGGAPVASADVSVCARTESGELIELNSPDPALQTRTAVDGTFEFLGLWPKTAYSVNAVRLVEGGESVTVDVAAAEISALTESELREIPKLILHRQKER